MKSKPDIVFTCNKCSHLVFLGKGTIEKIFKHNCPECGEEAYENWTIVRMGDYEKEYGA